jgi:DNA polymerase III psi subunit
MSLSHAYYLDAMGITRWHKIDAVAPVINYALSSYNNSSWLYPTSDDTELNQLLDKIIKSCKLGDKTADDIKLSSDKSAAELAHIQTTYTVILGKKLHQILAPSLAASCQIISLPSLEQMHKNPSLKKQAWQSLQVLIK